MSPWEKFQQRQKERQGQEKYIDFSDLRKINNMNERKMFENDFKYSLNEQKGKQSELVNNCLKGKFIHRSELNSKTGIKIHQFRDIGLPSRNLEKYTELYHS